MKSKANRQFSAAPGADVASAVFARFRPLVLLVMLAFVGLPPVSRAGDAAAASLSVMHAELLATDGLRLQFMARTDSYYVLYAAQVPKPIETPVAVRLGGESFGLIEHRPADAAGENRFYRLREVPLDQPLDLDGDGIDDVYELLHPEILNPLDSRDAAHDPDGNGLSHLDEYRAARAIKPRINDELPAEPQEAISREVSAFNFGRPVPRQSISREVSVFNFGRPGPAQAISRELSLFNFGPTNSVEAISRELSLFNFGDTNLVEAISREVSVTNGNPPQP